MAKHMTIAELATGRYVREEGWEPNRVETEAGESVSRANVLGVIISLSGDVPERMRSAVIDDRSGTIPVRSFGDEDAFAGLGVGDVINVIGRPREYGGERYLMAEIVKRIDDYAWVDARLLELRLAAIRTPKREPRPTAPSAAQAPEAEEFDDAGAGDIYQKVCELVRKHDAGEGAPTGVVATEAGSPDAERAIRQLLEEGEVFEVRPGRLKVLE